MDSLIKMKSMSTQPHVQYDEKCPRLDKGLGVNAPTHAGVNRATDECISWECEHYCCADQKAVHSNFGLGSCNHDWACVLCDAHKFELDRKSPRLNSSHSQQSRMPSSA